MTKPRNLTHLSLFSGIGGLDLAAEAAGIETVGMCEWADFPHSTLQKQFPSTAKWKDIRTLTKESFIDKTGLHTVDIISGGFPCQPFSLAGKRKGTTDNRYLWGEMLRVIQEVGCTWVVGENVAGLLSMAEQRTAIKVESRTVGCFEDYDVYKGVYVRQEELLLPDIIQSLEKIGYQVQVFCIPACAVKAPHERARLAIVGHRV